MELRRSLSDLLAKARQRCFQHLLLHQLTRATAVMLGGAVIILVAGTEYLSAFWLVLLAAVALGAALYIAMRTRPSSYGVAQRIDAKLKLADTLSTATHFTETPGTADAAIRERQRMQAESVAESVDLKQALPLARPRALYPAAGLAVALAAVLLLRYAVLGTFDPRASLVASAYDRVFGVAKQQAKVPSSPEGGDQPGDGREESKEAAKNADFAGDPSANFDPAAPENQKEQGKAGKGDPGSNGNKEDSAGKDASSDEQKQGDQQEDGNQNAKASSEPSLLSKMREALNQMLNKMKSSPNQSANKQKGDPSEGEPQQGQDGQSQEQGEGQESPNGKSSSDAQNGSNNAQNKPSQEPQNGIGSQDGDKAAKQAEALKAMGKITDILGKRAENVKGAVMVEVGSTRQQLKTPAGQGQSTHAEAGSEIHRDEVLPIYEQFVQQYFETIRKPSPSASSAPQTIAK